jgi:hypothetical protein
MDNKEKIIELARKIKELSDRGQDGEKKSAEYHLHKLLKKHGLTLEDIMLPERTNYDFSLDLQIPIKFVMQVLSSCCGSSKEYGWMLYGFKSKSTKNKSYRIENIEPTLYFEFLFKVDFYWKDYQIQSEHFYSAYIQKNALYTKDSSTSPKEISEMSHEDIKKLRKTLTMMDSIDKVSCVKALE